MKRLKRRGGKRWLCLLVAIAAVGGYGYWAANRPLPELKPAVGSIQLLAQTPAPKLVWPGAGQAAVGVVGTQILETHGAETALPTASTAKLITALAVLNQKPLALNQPGPMITLGPADVALYNSYAAQGGSVVPVAAGEQISEYQMLQTLMLPSANNMADSLAIWAFGSLSAYSTFANTYAGQLGLAHTHVGTDASGFSPTTTSSARDLVRIGEVAMRNPVLAQIVSQSTATGLPIVNNIKNVNSLLGTDNIIGIKTGNTDEAGGVYVSASRASVNGKQVTVVTALIGAPNLFAALKTSLPLIQSAQANFAAATVIKAGAIVGNYQLPWGGTVTAIAAKNLSPTTWNGDAASGTINLKPIAADTPAGATVGNVTSPQSSLSNQQSIPIKLQNNPGQPTLWWRLTHP
jgi:D-alanyl-D-alanine carboxypeptidase (penicillin-binding protein 5/6)